jgi:hypothetical protein
VWSGDPAGSGRSGARSWSATGRRWRDPSSTRTRRRTAATPHSSRAPSDAPPRQALGMNFRRRATPMNGRSAPGRSEMAVNPRFRAADARAQLRRRAIRAACRPRATSGARAAIVALPRSRRSRRRWGRRGHGRRRAEVEELAGVRSSSSAPATSRSTTAWKQRPAAREAMSMPRSTR